MDEEHWDRLVAQLKTGKCTPFLGSGACAASIPTGRALARRWAKEYKYPFSDSDNLPRVMQFVATHLGDNVYLKELLTADINKARLPDFDAPAEPHALLASLPIPLYLTTNYDGAMMAALRRAGKEPRAVVCRWYRRGIPWDQERTLLDAPPHPDRPVVFHLHGAATDPKSLVLTEEDYLEFLINLAIDQGADDQRIIPTLILPALTTHPLLFLGYSLQDWNFRVLFQGLMRTTAIVQRRRHVSVQLLDGLSDQEQDTQARAVDFLDKYLEGWKISVYWGEAGEFCTELRDRLGSV